MNKIKKVVIRKSNKEFSISIDRENTKKYYSEHYNNVSKKRVNRIKRILTNNFVIILKTSFKYYTGFKKSKHYLTKNEILYTRPLKEFKK